jgi:histidinol phosphatase-like PHP family hydrolase
VTAAMHERNGAGLGGQDLHVHTTMSDGTVSLERIVELARDRGVAVGVADHISTRTPTRMVATDAALQRYLDALEREPVFVAGEFCWCDRLSTSLPPEILRRFDYRIGSNHGFALPDGTEGSPWWETLPPPWDRHPQEVMEIMVHNLCDMVRTMDIQIAAHATLTPPALLAIEPALEHWWTEPREDRFVEALARSGVALEISNRYRLPHDRLLRKGKQVGIRFSLGSDAHHEHQVARLDWAVETARRIGITADDLFVPERQRKS